VSAVVLAQELVDGATGGGVSTGEAIAFWVLGPLAVVAAVMMVLARSAVHSALFLAGVMLSLAGMYAAQDAPFLAAVQVIVYTGAVLMLFLFVLMLVGVDASDSLVETLRGQRVAAVGLGVGFAGLLIFSLGGAMADTEAVGLAEAQPDGNVAALARLLFVRYVFAFEVTSALLITAAIGAFVLAHKERTEPALTQRELARRRFASDHPFPMPGPGVYSGHHSTATPALLPDGSEAPGSVPQALESGGRGDDAGGRTVLS
jgi:NADH-quinone oxidoreductase subunit J